MEIDALNPETRKYVWEVCKKNYYDLGVDGFWLDNSEPDFASAAAGSKAGRWNIACMKK